MTLVFSQIKDQEKPVRILRHAIASGKLHHGYIFDGPRGVGKEQVAMALAVALICETAEEGCLECRHCRRIVSGTHPDVRCLRPADGKRDILVADVRRAQEWIGMRSHEGASRILIISPAERMNESSANALLKTLEEPRPGNYIVLITAQATALLPTVRSRCQMIRFNKLSSATVRALLMARGMDGTQAALLASISGGSIERADDFATADMDERLTAVRRLIVGAADKVPEEGLAAAELRDRGRAVDILELLLQVMEEFLMVRSGGVSLDALPLCTRLGASVVGVANRGSVKLASEHIAAINRAITSIERNNMNPQLAVECMLLNMRSRNKDSAWRRIGAK